MKVFGIGLTRTGTSSLAAALRILGYHCWDFPPTTTVIDLSLEYDALTDISVIPYLRQLDLRYPEAKFVMTNRDEDAWLDACERWWAAHPTNHRTLHARLAVYGTSVFNREHFRNVWCSHLGMVFAYFGRRPDRLLSLNVFDGDGWDKLCPFLGKPIPDQPYPHVRTSPKEWQYMGDAPNGYR